MRDNGYSFARQPLNLRTLLVHGLVSLGGEAVLDFATPLVALAPRRASPPAQT